MRVNVSLLDPDLQEALEQYYAAEQRFNEAKVLEEIDAAIYEMKAAEQRLEAALKRLKKAKVQIRRENSATSEQ